MSKRIILCIDGTNNSPDSGRTNVSRFMRMIEKKSPEQVAYYQPGVGTLDPDRPGSKVVAKLRRIRDLAFASLIYRHVQSAYRYLMSEYEEGDEIYIIGFSRGAYVSRVLAGMLTKIGLLHKGQEEMIPFAWKLYKPIKNFEAAARFKKFYARDISIKFLGLWDTVRSVGTPWKPVVFSHSLNNKKVEIVRHALALDECRLLYPANLWTSKVPENQDAVEVWFPGVHADVGGGYTGDEDAGLGAISLAWMMREAEAAGISFNQEQKERMVWRRDASAPSPMTVEAVTEEFINDTMHDEIESRFYWKIFERIPVPRWAYSGEGEWEFQLKPHNKQPRPVPAHTKYHNSVVLRGQQDPEYKAKHQTDSIPADRLVW